VSNDCKSLLVPNMSLLTVAVLVVILLYRPNYHTTHACAAHRRSVNRMPVFLFIVHQTAESCVMKSMRLQSGRGVFITS